MDVTPQKLKDSMNKPSEITNQGVLIEFGYIIANEDYYKMLYIFCQENKRKETHPYIQNETITEYSIDNLKNKILEKIEDRIKSIPGEHSAEQKRRRLLERRLVQAPP